MLDFFDVELEEGLEEGLEEVQGQLELDELHSMEEVQVGLELDEIQGLQEYLVQELKLDEGTRSVGRECVKEDKRPDSSWHGLKETFDVIRFVEDAMLVKGRDVVMYVVEDE
ncbi:hypothetical protein Tco_0700552 [Tanacetum coccineum]